MVIFMIKMIESNGKYLRQIIIERFDLVNFVEFFGRDFWKILNKKKLSMRI